MFTPPVIVLAFALSLAAALASTPTAADTAQGVEPKDKLTSDLAETLSSAAQDTLIPITIIMRDRVAQELLQQASSQSDKHGRSAAVIQTLKDHARTANTDIVRLLSDEQNAGGVGQRVTTLWIANGVATQATPRVINDIARRDDVAYVNHDRPIGDEVFPVEPQRINPLDKRLTNASDGIECGVELMGAPQVWDELGITGRNVVVGVIDTGACITHPDLENQIWVNGGELIGQDGIDDDGNGYIDDFHGWNFKDNNHNLEDINSHGTHVSGTIAGDGSNGTTTGMAPDAQLMILKFWNSISGESTIWEAMQYAVDKRADIISASIGWPPHYEPDRATWRMVCENAIAAGVVVIYAAGNDGDSGGIDSVRTPGNVPDVITVGGTDCEDNVYDNSSRGPVTWQDIPPYFDWAYPPGKTKPSIAAPAVDTVSTSNNCFGYMTKTGTSMATPHVSGTAALMLQADRSLDHFEVKELLMRTALDFGEPGTDNTYGAGRVDTYRAVRAAKQVTGDINRDGFVDVRDVLRLLQAWGPCEGDCPEDLNGNGIVDQLDLILLLYYWG